MSTRRKPQILRDCAQAQTSDFFTKPSTFTNRWEYLETVSTIRKQIIELLETGDHDAREISQLLHISEKEIYTHIPHIKKSALAQGKKVIIIPSSCLICDYRFKDRNRPEKPGKCPKCKSERISNPRYFIE